MQLPVIVRKPVSAQRFTTLGDWWEGEPGQFTISVSVMPDWRYEFLILIHELTEWAVCQARGIKTSDCDAFDSVWEQELERGFHSVRAEAGFDRRCPYRVGHVWGARMERLFAWLLGIRWREYTLICDSMMAARG